MDVEDVVDTYLKRILLTFLFSGRTKTFSFFCVHRDGPFRAKMPVPGKLFSKSS